MYKAILLLWLTAALGAFALKEAAPFEVLWYYQAYKIEWKSVDSSKRQIAGGCTHKSGVDLAFDDAAAAAGVAGICTIDEFTQYLGGKTYKNKFTSGEGLEPNDQKFQAYFMKLQDSAKKFEWRVVMPRLLPKTNPLVTLSTTPGERDKPLAPVIDQLKAWVQGYRDLAPSDSVIQGWVDKSIPYLKAATQYRIRDQLQFTQAYCAELNPGTTNLWTTNPDYYITEAILLEDGTETGDASTKYDLQKASLDPTAKAFSVDDYNNAMKAARNGQAYTHGSTTVGSGPDDTRTVVHLAMIESFGASVTDMSGPPPSLCNT
ncbi:hypothetical protein LTR78_003028 [Recurvomyces mirabilis]|uniref:Uncharacterized protein n=1 Tax=Recurvomyces mirabilis TaxID=574656 RepID=A0AAE0WRS8_9PEZI|nr:hypothetical protein LTR78_003028 [Recurvomyces mirabilis]KAK5157151.1 hypothetical protein LTS14_004669 [Recurvomyces mirabilis]